MLSPSGRKPDASNVETLSAAALVFDVRIVEAKTFVQSFAREVELGAVDIRKAFRIDEHFYTVRFEHHVLASLLVNVFELVSHAGTAGGAHAETQTNALAAPLQIAADMLCSLFGQSNCHISFSVPRLSAGKAHKYLYSLKRLPSPLRRAWPCNPAPPPCSRLPPRSSSESSPAASPELRQSAYS